MEINCWQVGKHPPKREENCLEVGMGTSPSWGGKQAPGCEKNCLEVIQVGKQAPSRERNSFQVRKQSLNREGNASKQGAEENSDKDGKSRKRHRPPGKESHILQVGRENASR